MKKEKKPKKEKGEKSGGKKKLLLIPIILLVVAAVAAAVILLVLPHFGIDLLGGGDEVGDPIPKKGLEVYTIEEESVPALDTILEEGDGELLANRGPGKNKTMEDNAASTVFGERYTYIYELTNYAAVVDRYLDLLLSAEQGFSLVDETYLVQEEERPVLEDAQGALILARTSTVQEGHIFQIVLGWSQASDNLAVRVAAPEGALRYPEPEPEEPKEPGFDPASLEEHLSKLKTVDPARLGLPGQSMDEYEIYAMGGFVTVDGYDCRRFTVHSRVNPGDIMGIFLISADQQHYYQLDPETNMIMELK